MGTRRNATLQRRQDRRSVRTQEGISVRRQKAEVA